MFDIVPWRKNNSLQRKGDDFENMVNSFFNDDFFSSLGVLKNNFSVDLKEDDNDYIIEADLPGVDKKDIEISYKNGYLNIVAKRNNHVEEKKDNYIRRERSYGSVSRGFYITNVDKNSIKAKFDNGVLNIELPKKEVTTNNSTQILIE